MKSSSKKSALKWLLSGFTAFTLSISLAGCSQTAEESPELEKTSDASLTETAEYVPASAEGPARNVPEPLMPIVVTEDSVDGAKAALVYLVESIQYARTSGNTDALESISNDDCDFCQENINQWNDLYSDGAWIVSEEALEIEIIDEWFGYDEELEASAAEFEIDLFQPASDLYEEAQFNEAESVETDNISRWQASMIYDGTAQRWKVEWMYLLERDIEEP